VIRALTDRVVTPSLILKKLAAYRHQNSLAAALREIGRIERTLFTLRWFEDPNLRQLVTAELNKGEARNTLARAVAIHRWIFESGEGGRPAFPRWQGTGRHQGQPRRP
jgi:TnpA family transposase